ncbi:hypothetical protein N1851_028501 [Merluccius polli]|uniref:Uncharacterized protein n=1 Tax=Merluccius polli TaxID=89951 RepID=A0AA47M8L7_MERPO|nr:hypothetical protein N1851_028501 [Merluccius polli]
MSVLRAPLHTIFLRCPFLSGPVKVGVRPLLPVRGVALILGNDLVGGKVFPSPNVVDNPVSASPQPASTVFPACVVTRAQARKFDDVVNLSDSFLCPVEPVKPEIPSVENEKAANLLPPEAELILESERSCLSVSVYLIDRSRLLLPVIGFPSCYLSANDLITWGRIH